MKLVLKKFLKIIIFSLQGRNFFFLDWTLSELLSLHFYLYLNFAGITKKGDTIRFKDLDFGVKNSIYWILAIIEIVPTNVIVFLYYFLQNL